MKHSKLIKVLKTFNKSEFREFGKFVHSPYFSSGRNVIPLFESLKKYYPNFDSKEFNRDNILEELSRKGYKATYQQLKTQMSEMYKLSEEFLTLQNSKKETGLNTYYLAKNLRNRGHYKIGESVISKELKRSDGKGIDGDFYHNYYYGRVELINFYFMKDKPLQAVKMLESMSEALLHQFLCNISRYHYNMIVLRRAFNVSSEQNLLYIFFNTIDYENILKLLEGRKDALSKASRLYILFIQLFLKFGQTKYYFRLKNELFKNIGIFSYYDQSQFLQAVNFWADEMIKGVTYNQFAKETFEIINFRLKNNLYKQTPVAPYTFNEFRSAFSIGFILKEKEWLRGFINKYLDEVPEADRKECLKYSNVYLDFLDKRYAKCLKDINKLQNLTLPSMYGIKRLKLMALYELGYIVEAFYAVDAFKSFLKQNKKVSEEFMESNTNFIRFYSNLLKHKHGEKELSLKQILAEVKNSSTDNQEWIIEKINEM